MTAEQFADAIASITGEWRVLQPENARSGVYTREWHVASSPLTRALARPIRDQVITTRNPEATTLQALELVNGSTLTRWLARGSRRMLGELPPEPASIFDSGPVRGSGRSEPKPISFDVDVANTAKLWLLVQDIDSYAPERVEPMWEQSEFVGKGGAVTPVASMKPLSTVGVRASGSDGVRVKSPSRIVYEIAGKGFTRFRGSVVLEKGSMSDDIMPNVRFFIFDQEPDMERLVPVSPGTPNISREGWTAQQLVDNVFWHALGRAPSARERSLSESALLAGGNRPRAAGLADLLWVLVMSPDFQLMH